jgi:hypothetical protein
MKALPESIAIPPSAWATAQGMVVVRVRTSVIVKKVGLGPTAVTQRANGSNSAQVMVYAVRLIIAIAKPSGKEKHVMCPIVRLTVMRPSNAQATVSVLGHSFVCATTPTSGNTVKS